jgi:hypothetical protein
MADIPVPLEQPGLRGRLDRGDGSGLADQPGLYAM